MNRLSARRPAHVAALLAALSVTSVFATPANDNYATRALLNPSGAATSVNNTGATLESGEPIPGGYTASTYQATTWWDFNAVFDGWYQIETTGSAINTVLAIWTGSNFASPLVLVHVNDEASPGSGSSLIYLHAQSGITYRVSVASRTSARGTVMLQASLREFEAPAEVTSGQFSPDTVNVGGATGSTTLAVAIQQNSLVFDSGVLTLFDPAGVAAATAAFTAANQPDPFDPTFIIPITIPANSPVGNYRWNVSFQSSTGSGFVYGSHGWEASSPLPDGTPQTITVISDSYANWLASNSMTGTDSTRSADYDRDGVKNLVEFAFGTDPHSSVQGPFVLSGNSLTRAGMPVATTAGSGDQMRLRIEFVRRLNDPSLTYTVQFSDDLVNWTNAANAPFLIGSSLGLEAVAVEDTVITPARTRRYARVVVTQ